MWPQKVRRSYWGQPVGTAALGGLAPQLTQRAKALPCSFEEPGSLAPPSLAAYPELPVHSIHMAPWPADLWQALGAAVRGGGSSSVRSGREGRLFSLSPRIGCQEMALASAQTPLSASCQQVSACPAGI